MGDGYCKQAGVLREPGKSLTGDKRPSPTITGSAEEGISDSLCGSFCGECTGFNGMLPLHFSPPLSSALPIALPDQCHCMLPTGNSSLISKEQTLQREISCPLHEKSLKRLLLCQIAGGTSDWKVLAMLTTWKLSTLERLWAQPGRTHDLSRAKKRQDPPLCVQHRIPQSLWMGWEAPVVAVVRL